MTIDEFLKEMKRLLVAFYVYDAPLWDSIKTIMEKSIPIWFEEWSRLYPECTERDFHQVIDRSIQNHRELPGFVGLAILYEKLRDFN